MTFENYSYTVVDRFLKYVGYDTQSDDNSTTVPSTEKQLVLLKELVKELEEFGLEDVVMAETGEVYATLPANTTKENIPTIGFLAHVDTAPANSGKDVKPIIHEKPEGEKIVLPKDNQVIDLTEWEDWKTFKDKTLITSDGSTLLGGDDKAGVAEIMDALNYFKQHPEVKHGTIRIAFTPDEEIGRGTDHFDVKKFNATFAYTVDGGQPGDAGVDNFSADKVTITFKGKDIHPGYAKGILINSQKIAATFIDSLPKEKMSPETTEGREPFVHVISINGTVEETTLTMINRAFTQEELDNFRTFLNDLAKEACDAYPGSSYDLEAKVQYKNMAEILKQHQQGVDYITEAMLRIGIQPNIKPTRGGTDGASLSYEGLPCPNIFAGERNFHAKTEFVVVEDLQLAVQNIVEIAKLWEENA